MTPFRAAVMGVRGTVLAPTPFSHGAVIANVNWLTLGTRRGCCPVNAGIARMHGPSSFATWITYCKRFNSRSSRLSGATLAALFAVQAVDDELRPIAG
jgi:hypothetical protein